MSLCIASTYHIPASKQMQLGTHEHTHTYKAVQGFKNRSIYTTNTCWRRYSALKVKKTLRDELLAPIRTPLGAKELHFRIVERPDLKPN